MAEEQGITVKKEDNFSEWFSQVVQKANLADIRFGVQGFVVYPSWGFKIIRKIYEYLEEEIEKDDHEPYWFPTIVKKRDLEKEKEHAGFSPDVFWVTKAGDKNLEEEFALKPTGEAQIYPMYSLWIRSYQDLPFKAYQDRMFVYRNEKTTRPFIRGKEFPFFESHDVFASHEEGLKQVKKDSEICKKVIYEKLKIPFVFFKRPQWDKFKGAVDTYVPDTLLPDGKRNQLASTHDLGQRFAKAYNVEYLDKNGKKQYAWQTCFGPGIIRIAAAIFSIHGDNNGLILPFDLAPLQVIIIPVLFSKKKSENNKVLKKCYDIKEKIEKFGYKVKVDDSENSPGWKYHHWELFGVPLRLEIGPREVKASKATLVKRTEKKKIEIKLKELDKEIKKHAKSLDNEIQKRADDYFKDNKRSASSLKELQELLNKHKGFIKVPFCSDQMDGEKCGEKLKEETDGANVCGVKVEKAEKSSGKCIICGKKAGVIVYVAKSY